MRSTLFILLKSPNEYQTLDQIAALGGDDHIGVILLEDATLFPLYEEKKEELISVSDERYIMGEDLNARGFKGKAGKEFQIVDYPTMVDLIMDGYARTITL